MKKLFENFRHYLDEVEAFDTIATTQDEIQKSLDYFYTKHAPSKGKRKDLGNWKGHKMVGFELSGGDLFFFVVDKEDKPLMYVAIAPFRESYAIGNVRKTKGGGFYATDIYEWLVGKFGSIYSDKAQTEDGKGIWERFPELIEGEPPPPPPYKQKVATEKEDGKDKEGNPKWRWRLRK